MREGNNAAIDFAGQSSEARLYELADLAAVVLVAPEGIGDGVDDDELRAEFAGLVKKLVEKRRRLTPATVEGHEEVLLAEARQPSHVFEIGKLAAIEPVYIGLSPVQLVLVILAEHAERSHTHNRKPEPGLADRGGSHELLSQQALAEPAIAVKPGDGEEGNPVRRQPSPFRYGLVLQRDRIKVTRRRRFDFLRSMLAEPVTRLCCVRQIGKGIAIIGHSWRPEAFGLGAGQ